MCGRGPRAEARFRAGPVGVRIAWRAVAAGRSCEGRPSADAHPNRDEAAVRMGHAEVRTRQPER
jgi:hypothetical protein